MYCFIYGHSWNRCISPYRQYLLFFWNRAIHLIFHFVQLKLFLILTIEQLSLVKERTLDRELSHQSKATAALKDA